MYAERQGGIHMYTLDVAKAVSYEFETCWKLEQAIIVLDIIEKTQTGEYAIKETLEAQQIITEEIDALVAEFDIDPEQIKKEFDELLDLSNFKK